jgi:hypothetical protein
MHMDEKAWSRRFFLGKLAIALPGSAILLRYPAAAQDLPHLTEDDPQAMALAYVHDAASVDTSNPAAARYEPGQTCANCLQIMGEEGAEWRPCAIFPGKLVSSAGWCSVWVAKP